RNGDGGCCGGGRRGREEREAESDKAGAGCSGGGDGVVDDCDAALLEIAAGLPGDVVECGTEPGDETDGGRVGALSLDGILALLAEIEVVARVSGLFHGGPGLLADAEISQAGRNHHRLLRSADEDVDAPAVHVEVGGAQAGDAVND